MATLESLRPGQRSVLQLLVRHGRSYVSLAQTFQTTPERARERAHEVVEELVAAPASIDPDRRARVVDYVLGQLPPAEAGPVREHLEASPDERSWARELIVALDPLYGERERPAVPDAGEPEGESTGGEHPATAGDTREPERPGPVFRRFTPARDRPPVRPAAAPAQPKPRRQGALWLIALAVLLAAGAGAVTLWRGGGGDGGQAGDQPRLRVEHQAVMRPPPGGAGGGGIAVITSRGGRRRLLVQARLQGAAARARHELWLYRGAGQARSLGIVTIDARGNLRFAAALPPDFRSYPRVDLSREPADGDPRHSGRSVLRARLPG